MDQERQADNFQWDKGNINKSYKKHGITPNEAEEVFVDRYVIVNDDERHSKYEKRFIAIGKSISGKHLFVVYTIRKKKIRIISARSSSNKERRLYEKIKKNTTF